MEINGKIIQKLEVQSGTSARGEWRKQELILETMEQFPKKICFAVWGDRIDEFPLEINNEVTVSFDVESREYNGRWYTNLKAWKVENTKPGGGENDFSADFPSEEPYIANDSEGSEADDLPF